METFFITGNLFVVCIVLGVLLGYGMQRKEFETLRRELALMKSKYLHAYGFHEWFGIYDLESFDSGQMWYAMMTTSDGKRLIRGEAETIYPGIMSEHGIFESDMVSMKPRDVLIASKETGNKRLPDIVQMRSQTARNEAPNPQRACLKVQVRNQSYCRSMPILPPKSSSASQTSS